MCDPLTIASIALTAGSIVANQVAQGEQVRARDDVLAAERVRQKRFDMQAQTINDGTRDSFVGFEPQQAERAATIGDELASRVADPNSAAASIMPSSSSNVVNQETAKQVGDAQAYVDQQTGAMAEIRSLGDLLGEKARGQSRDASAVAQINSFKQGSQGLVPLELDEAAKAGDGWKLFADILGGAGSIGTGYAINNGSTNIANMFKPMSAKAGAAVGGVTKMPVSMAGGYALGVT